MVCRVSSPSETILSVLHPASSISIPIPAGANADDQAAATLHSLLEHGHPGLHRFLIHSFVGSQDCLIFLSVLQENEKKASFLLVKYVQKVLLQRCSGANL